MEPFVHFVCLFVKKEKVQFSLAKHDLIVASIAILMIRNRIVAKGQKSASTDDNLVPDCVCREELK